MARPVRSPLRLRLHHLIPAAIAVGAALYLRFAAPRDVPGDGSLFLALLAASGALFLLHCALALRLHHTVAFLAGLELGYCALVLLRSAWTALLGVRAAEYALGFTLLLPATLILIVLLGQAPLSAPRSILRVGVIVLFPLLWALLLRKLPDLPGLLSPRGRLAVPVMPSFLPSVPALALLLALGVVLAAPRRPRSLFDFCLAASLLPVYVLLHRFTQAAAPEAGGAGAAAGRLAPGVYGPLAAAWAAVFVILLYGLYRLFWQRAFVDELTGLGNRRSLEDRLRFPGRRYTLAMIDIDHFKAINDRYGHAEGDNVLRWVAGHIRRSFGERAYRYGGEEFVVVLPELEPGPAQAALEALRRGLAEAQFCVRTAGERRGSRRPGKDRRRAQAGRATASPRGRGRARIRVTVSIGLAGASAGSKRPREVLERADQALYRAKSAGRNRVVAARPAPR